MIRQIQILEILLSISICLGCSERKNADQLKEIAIENEASFMRLVDDFQASLPDSNYIVTFGIGNKGCVDLTFYRNQGNMAERKNRYGGHDLRLHSPKLDDALKILGWTYKTIDKLKNGLGAIRCDHIRNTDWFGKPINIYDGMGGFIKADYNIYPTEMLDSVRTMHGEPIGQTDFLKRVYVMTSSAL